MGRREFPDFTFFQKPISEQSLSDGIGVLSVSLSRRIPFSDALETLINDAANKCLRDFWVSIRAVVVENGKISAAFALHQALIPRTVVMLAKIGENNNCLPEALACCAAEMRRKEAASVELPGWWQKFARYFILRLFASSYTNLYARPQDLEDRLRESLFFPAVVATISFSLVFGLLGLVVPQFLETGYFSNREIPLVIEALFFCSRHFCNWWPVMVPALLAIPLSLIALLLHVRGRRFLDSILTRIVPVSRVIRMWRIARTKRVRFHVEKLGLAFDKVVEPLMIPDLYLEDSETNTPGTSSVPRSESAEPLLAANQIEESVRITTDLWLACIEPVCIVCMGVFIGGIILALFMPPGGFINEP